jgi:hypothetical protein
LIDDAYSIENDSIVIVVGTGIRPADEAGVVGLAIDTLFQAQEARTHLTAQYVPVEAEANEVDLALLYDHIRVEPVSSAYDPATIGATESATGVNFDIEAAQVMLDNAGDPASGRGAGNQQRGYSGHAVPRRPCAEDD